MSKRKTYEDPSTGDIYGPAGPASIVRQMARSKLTTSASRKSYREGVATRLAEVMDLQVDASSDTLFLSSLVEAGVLIERG